MHTIETPRLLIRPLEPSKQDENMFIELYTTTKIMRFIGPVLDKETACKTFKTALKKNERKNQRLNTWAIVNRETGQPIGIQFLFKRPNQPPNTAEIGIMLLLSAHGKLLADEAVRNLLNYAYNKRRLDKVYACFSNKNVATKRIVSKLGFLFDTHSFTNVASDITGYFVKTRL